MAAGKISGRGATHAPSASLLGHRTSQAFVAAGILLATSGLTALDLKVASSRELAEPEQQLYSMFRNSCIATASFGSPELVQFRTRYTAVRLSLGICDNKVALWDLREGRERWKRYMDGPVMQVKQTPAHVLVLTTRTLTSFGLEGGNIDWQFDLGLQRYNRIPQLGSRFALYREKQLSSLERGKTRIPAFAASRNGRELLLVLPSGRMLRLLANERSEQSIEAPWTRPMNDAGFYPVAVDIEGGSLFFLAHPRVAYRLRLDGTVVWSFRFPRGDTLLTAREVDGRCYLLGMRHAYVVSPEGRLIAESVPIRCNALLSAVYAAWADLVLIPDERKGLVAMDADLKKVRWTFQGPHLETVRFGIVNLGTVAEWQGAVCRLVSHGEDAVLVQQFDSLFALDPETGRVESRVKLHSITEAQGLALAAPILLPASVPFVDPERRSITLLLGSVSGTIGRQLDAQTVRDYLVGIKW